MFFPIVTLLVLQVNIFSNPKPVISPDNNPETSKKPEKTLVSARNRTEIKVENQDLLQFPGNQPDQTFQKKQSDEWEQVPIPPTKRTSLKIGMTCFLDDPNHPYLTDPVTGKTLYTNMVQGLAGPLHYDHVNWVLEYEREQLRYLNGTIGNRKGLYEDLDLTLFPVYTHGYLNLRTSTLKNLLNAALDPDSDGSTDDHLDVLFIQNYEIIDHNEESEALLQAAAEKGLVIYDLINSYREMAWVMPELNKMPKPGAVGGFTDRALYWGISSDFTSTNFQFGVWVVSNSHIDSLIISYPGISTYILPVHFLRIIADILETDGIIQLNKKLNHFSSCITGLGSYDYLNYRYPELIWSYQVYSQTPLEISYPDDRLVIINPEQPTAIRHVILKNKSDKNYTVNTNRNEIEANFIVEPSTFRLNAGDSIQVTLTFTFKPGDSPFSYESLAGVVTFYINQKETAGSVFFPIYPGYPLFISNDLNRIVKFYTDYQDFENYAIHGSYFEFYGKETIPWILQPYPTNVKFTYERGYPRYITDADSIWMYYGSGYGNKFESSSSSFEIPHYRVSELMTGRKVETEIELGQNSPDFHEADSFYGLQIQMNQKTRWIWGHYKTDFNRNPGKTVTLYTKNMGQVSLSYQGIIAYETDSLVKIGLVAQTTQNLSDGKNLFKPSDLKIDRTLNVPEKDGNLKTGNMVLGLGISGFGYILAAGSKLTANKQHRVIFYQHDLSNPEDYLFAFSRQLYPIKSNILGPQSITTISKAFFLDTWKNHFPNSILPGLNEPVIPSFYPEVMEIWSGSGYVKRLAIKTPTFDPVGFSGSAIETFINPNPVSIFATDTEGKHHVIQPGEEVKNNIMKLWVETQHPFITESKIRLEYLRDKPSTITTPAFPLNLWFQNNPELLTQKRDTLLLRLSKSLSLVKYKPAFFSSSDRTPLPLISNYTNFKENEKIDIIWENANFSPADFNLTIKASDWTTTYDLIGVLHSQNFREILSDTSGNEVQFFYPWPNPTNSRVFIRVKNPPEGSASILIYNILGQQVASIKHEIKTQAVILPVDFDPTWASGLYFFKINLPDHSSKTYKVTYLK